MQNSYIDPTHKVLRYFDRLAAVSEGLLPAPVGVEIDLTNRCSLGCVWCHFAFTHTARPDKGAAMWHAGQPANWQATGDEFDPVILSRILADLERAGVLSVTWTGGGEPLIYPHFEDIVGRAAKLGLHQGIYTNGCHIRPATAGLLVDTHDWVYVSLDAANADSFARLKNTTPAMFERAVAGIEALVEANADMGTEATIGVGFLLNEGNWTEVFDMIELARSLRATYVQFRPAVVFDDQDPARVAEDTSWAREVAVVLENLGDEPDIEFNPARFRQYADWDQRGRTGYHTCFSVLFTTVITPDARLWACVNRRGYGPESLIGDLTNKSFLRVWRDHPGPWRDFRQCRAFCRGHMMNQSLAAVLEPRPHTEFV